MTSIKSLAIRGTLWTIASYGASQIIRFISNPVLASLLSPELLGLNSLIGVFITGLMLFSDIGIGPSLIRNNQADDPAFYNTAWTLQVIRGGILWLGCLLITWPVYLLYQTKEGANQLLWLIPIVGLGSIIGGLNSTAIFQLNRELAMRQLTLYTFFTQVLTTGVLLIWASITRDIWALALSGLVSGTIAMLWSHRLMPGVKNRLTWDPAAAREIFSFGKWIFISTAITFLSENIDRILLGKFTSFEVLGVYGVAFAFADIPRQVLLAVSTKVFFPVFTKFAELPRHDFRQRILKNRQILLWAMAVGLALLTSFGDVLIRGLHHTQGGQLFRGLYNESYAQASWMLPVLAIGFWPKILTQTIDQVFFALGKPTVIAKACLAKFVFMAIGMPLAFYGGLGLLGTILVIALNDVPFYCVILVGLIREKISPLAQDIQATVLFLIMLAGLVGIRFSLGYGLPIDALFP